jgi:hypothetical protein
MDICPTSIIVMDMRIKIKGKSLIETVLPCLIAQIRAEKCNNEENMIKRDLPSAATRVPIQKEYKTNDD